MKLFLALVAVSAVILTSWVYSGSVPSRASGQSTVFLPFVMREAWMEEVTIVQRDGYQAIYWPSTPPSSPFQPATPTPTGTPAPAPVAAIPIYLEVQNHTDRNITSVQVEFRANDSSGSPITQTIASSLLDVLRPGQRSPAVLNVPFPGGYTAFQAASKGFMVLPNWSFTDRDPQAGLEFSPSFPLSARGATPALPASSGTALAPKIAEIAIPHTLEGRSACTICHTVGGAGVGAPGGTGLPASHEGRTDATCTGCHRSATPPTPTPAATPTRTPTPNPVTPTPAASLPLPPNPSSVFGWVKNNGKQSVSGAFAVITIRGDEKAHNLVLDAARVPIYGSIPPGGFQSIYASFVRDYGDLYAGYEVVVQGTFQSPGLLGTW